jgi:hypothetical protein
MRYFFLHTCPFWLSLDCESKPFMPLSFAHNSPGSAHAMHAGWGWLPVHQVWADYWFLYSENKSISLSSLSRLKVQPWSAAPRSRRSPPHSTFKRKRCAWNISRLGPSRIRWTLWSTCCRWCATINMVRSTRSWSPCYREISYQHCQVYMFVSCDVGLCFIMRFAR